jgi:NAD+ synthase/NAD+ synthase (glutamine-hydrolysing)
MRLFLAPLNPTIGDIPGNAALVADAARRAREAGADLVLCPELCISGYPPKDLLLQEGFLDACAKAAKDLGEKHSAGITLVFGCPLPLNKSATPARPRAGSYLPPTLANSLLAYRDGTLVAWYDKRLLPTYDVFDEDRYFEPGSRAVIIEVPCRDGTTARAGLSICEDLWKGEDAGFASRYDNAPDPVAELAAAGVDVILSPSASPYVIGKDARHLAILRGHAERHRAWVVSLNQLGGNDELVFDGHTYAIAPGGATHAAGTHFTGEPLLVDITIGKAAVQQASPTIANVPAGPDAETPALFRALVTGVRDYCRKTGFRTALLGLSGGIDSAVTAAIGVAALGGTNVTGVGMPGPYSSDHSVEDARISAELLGMPFQIIPIKAPFDGFRAAIDPAFRAMNRPTMGEKLPDIAEENLQSRIRGTLLMAISNRDGSILLTTGNKSELAVGYCTLYGDMNGGLAVLSDVTKEWVYRLAGYMNDHAAACGFARPPIPERSITKPPSAELRPDQKDQDSLPPYDVLDEIIARFVERRQAASTIAAETGFDRPLIDRILRLIDLAEFKRKQTAIGIKVTSVAFGSGRRVPIVQRWRSP